MDAMTEVPEPVNEPIRNYAPGSPERTSLEVRIKELSARSVELPMTIGGEQRLGAGAAVPVVQPHNRRAVLGTLHEASTDDVRAAVSAAEAAAPAWRSPTPTPAWSICVASAKPPRRDP